MEYDEADYGPGKIVAISIKYKDKKRKLIKILTPPQAWEFLYNYAVGDFLQYLPFTLRL